MKTRHLILAFILTIVPPAVWAEQQPDLTAFFVAVGQVESGHDDTEVGDGGDSIGRYQIQWAFWRDAEDRIKSGGRWRDVTDKAYAERIMHAYYKRWEPKAYYARDYEVLARAHNSGPGWADKKHKTDAYWAKVSKELDK